MSVIEPVVPAVPTVSHEVAVAVLNVQKAQVAVDAVRSTIESLAERLADANKRHVDAFEGLRSKATEFSEEVLAGRMAVSKADVTDLNRLIEAAHPSLNEANEAYARAINALKKAEQDAERHALNAEARALDSTIKALEAKMLEAIQARYDIKRKLDPRSQRNLGGCYRPTPALQEVVNHELPPRA